MKFWKRFLTLSFLLMLASRLAAQETDIQSRLSGLYRQQNYTEALDLAGKALGQNPDNLPLVQWMAYLHSRIGHPDSALFYLDRSLDLGYTDYLEYLMDPDLESLRVHPGFERIIGKAKLMALEENRMRTLRLTSGEPTRVEMTHASGFPAVQMDLDFNFDALKINAVVKDTHFKDGNRSWRYGDGFFINLFSPDAADTVYSNRFYAYGFSRQEGEPIACLINRDGTYFLALIRDLTPSIEIDSSYFPMRSTFTITIPWKRLYPFHPLLDESGGINIIYNSQNEDRSLKRLVYIPNAQFDTEMTDLRRFAPVEFTPSSGLPLYMTGRMKTRLIAGERADVKLAVWAPGKMTGRFSLRVTDAEGVNLAETPFQEVLKPGKNVLSRSLTLTGAGGTLTLTATLNDTLTWSESFFMYNPSGLNKAGQTVSSAAGDPSPVFTTSRDLLEYRLGLVEEQIAGFTQRKDPKKVRESMEETLDLVRVFQQKGTVFHRSGVLLSAFRSPMDSTLQPFSIYLPENFDPGKTYHLMVALHGSGVDEQGFIRYFSGNYSREDLIVLAPRGRHLSAWYLGDTERDVADLVRLVQNMFSVDRTFLFGFSMGGYGVWRMGFLHEALFDAAVCVSGPPLPWVDNRPENDMRNHIGKGKSIRYLVFHGTEDHAVDITDTDDFMEKLKENGYNVTYIRVPGAGHGNFSFGEIMVKWLGENIFQ